MQHGVGTACEGWVQIPKPGGVRKGWQRAYAIVCDFKIFVHEPGTEDIRTPAVQTQYIFDIRYGFVCVYVCVCVCDVVCV